MPRTRQLNTGSNTSGTFRENIERKGHVVRQVKAGVSAMPVFENIKIGSLNLSRKVETPSEE